MRRFEGKVALVTGASGVVGRASALAYAGEGAAVLAAGRDEAGLAELERRSALLGDLLVVCAVTMRRLAGFYPEVDDAVARDLGGS